MSKTIRSNEEIQKIINTIKKLPLSQLKVLLFLSFRGPSWPSQISGEIGVPGGTIRPALRQLRSKGYLTQALNGIYKSNICFPDIIISEIIHKHEEFESRLLASVSKVIHKQKEFESHVYASVSKVIHKYEEDMLESVSKFIHTHEEEFESRLLASVSKFIHTHEEEFESRLLASVSKSIHTHEEEFESRLLASVSKSIHTHEEKFESSLLKSVPIIIPVPEKSIIAIKNLKDAGYSPSEIKRIMKAKGINVPANALRDLLKEPVFPEDFFDVKEALE